jgi:hypothetical protein
MESQLKALAAAFADARRDGFPGWGHVVAAALIALGLAVWVARAAARPYRSPLPRYARAVPLVAQGGVAGRFAVLAAPSSPRSLALLEWKSALFEALQQRFALATEPTPDALCAMARKAGRLDESTHSALTGVLRTMNDVESAVVSGRPANVSAATLARAAETIRAVLAACGAASPLAPRPAPDPERAPEPRETGDIAG